MLKRDGPCLAIVNVFFTAAESCSSVPMPAPTLGRERQLYSIAQAASETLRRAFQAEWADGDIAVGGFKPGLVDTDLVRGFMRLSKEEFPARPAYESYASSGQIVGPDVIARFAAWLLLDVQTRRFTETDWGHSRRRAPDRMVRWAPLFRTRLTR